MKNTYDFNFNTCVLIQVIMGCAVSSPTRHSEANFADVVDNIAAFFSRNLPMEKDLKEWSEAVRKCLDAATQYVFLPILILYQRVLLVHAGHACDNHRDDHRT